MRSIFFLKGLPASGKSTEAMALLAKHPNRYMRVNKDLIRLMLMGQRVDFNKEKIVMKIRRYVIESILGRGYDVIIDDTNLKEKYYLETCDIARAIGDIQIVEKYFECPLEECIRRNKGRPGEVPEDLIHQMYKSNIEGKVVPQRTEYFPPVKKEFKYNPKLPSAIMVDIDNTLALHESGRSPFDWTKVIEDSVNVPVADVVRMYAKNNVMILILSGREDICREDTETWLKCNDIPYNILLMRTAGDSRGDEIVKKEIFDKNVKNKYNVLFVLDDREKVVSAWRSAGLACFQVNPGNF